MFYTFNIVIQTKAYTSKDGELTRISRRETIRLPSSVDYKTARKIADALDEGGINGRLAIVNVSLRTMGGCLNIPVDDLERVALDLSDLYDKIFKAKVHHID